MSLDGASGSSSGNIAGGVLVGRRVKRVVVFGFVCACASQRAPVVDLSTRVVVQTPEPLGASLLGGCSVVGTGERPRDTENENGGVPFEVFESNDARLPAFVIARPDHARATWSDFPERADDGRTRAHVSIGGQRHLRYDGFAGLFGRTFTTKRRMSSVDGHLWVRAGAAIDVMSATAHGDVYARAATPFASPKSIVVHGNCADLVYEYEVTPRAPSKKHAATASLTPTLRLFSSPSVATAFTTLTQSIDHPIAFEVREQSGERVRVVADDGDVEMDAWVRASDVGPLATQPESRSTQRATSTSAPTTAPSHALVGRDTELFVDDGFSPPTRLRGAIVEKDASIAYDVAHGSTVNGREIVPFAFDDGFIAPREGTRLWIATDALVRAR